MDEKTKNKRGPKLGQRTGPRDDSWNSYLLSMEVGERRYLETTTASYSNLMRTVIVPRSRRTDALKGRQFKSTLYTAISAADCADVRYLVAVDRTE